MKQNWWKALSVILLLYTIVMGFVGKVPALPILHETIRNLYFHVTMWFSMITLFSISLVYSIRYLADPLMKYDLIAEESSKVGMLFGILGLITGSLWARFTWGAWWVNDTKLNGAAICMLIYLAYTILRNSLDEEQKRAKVAAVYNIFAYTMMVVFLLILPRMTASLHPGNGGNPGFNSYDLDNNMRMVFYPAIIGWILLSLWILQLRVRFSNLKRRSDFV